MQTQWTDNNDYLSYTFNNSQIVKSDKIASFDLDCTIIKTKSKKKFAVDENDWEFLYDNIPKVLEDLVKEKFRVIIISNQRGLKTPEKVKEWKKKVELITAKLNIPIEVFCSTTESKYRKPMTGFLDLIGIKSENVGKIDRENSFYCGDAAGRQDSKKLSLSADFSDTDLKFAINSKLKFYTPEQYFLKKDERTANIIYPFVFPNIEIKNKQYVFTPSKDKEMIILMGYPGAGKSSFYNSAIKHHGYERINQDELKTKAKCEKQFNVLINKGNNIVIDNTNPKKETREYYIKLAKKNSYYIRCLHVNPSFDISLHNNYYRHYKENKKLVPQIAYNIYKSKLEVPKTDEGIDKIEEIHFDSLIDISKLDDKYKTYYF